MLNIVQIGEASYAELAKLAQDIYQEHYLHLWYPGGADWYMYTHSYAPEVIKTELMDPASLHYFVSFENRTIGYLKLNLAKTIPGDATHTSLEIERIYLRKEETGKGFGKILMEFCEILARKNNYASLFLKAMDSSEAAIRFYQTQGYRITGTLGLPFPLLKEEFRGMLILQKDIQ